MHRRTFCSLPLAAAASAMPALAPRQNNASAAAGSAAPADPGAPKAAIEAWKDLRFGMFVHWDPVSIVGTEISWSRAARKDFTSGKMGIVPVEVYDNLYRMFNPLKFNPDEWVQLAKDSGMRYLMFTCKHHDGFCNFDSKLTDYKITSPQCPYGKDIVRQVADACHRAGMNFGIYYSQPDWHNPDYRNGAAHARYVEYLHGQVRELLTTYGPAKMWFFDGLGGTAADWDAPRLLNMMRGIEPNLIINNRAGLPADNDTPEQQIGHFQDNRPWETCATVGAQWAYDPDDVIRPLEECLRGLVCCAIGDGNFLFNIGPRPDGRMEPSHAERLRQMGAFLAKYGESIYATRGGPFVAPDEKKRPANARGFALAEGNWWGGSTHKEQAIYLHILRWPAETIELPSIPRKILRHRVLTGGGAAVHQTESGIRVSVAKAHRDAIDTIIKLELDGPAAGIAAMRPA